MNEQLKKMIEELKSSAKQNLTNMEINECEENVDKIINYSKRHNYKDYQLKEPEFFYKDIN